MREHSQIGKSVKNTTFDVFEDFLISFPEVYERCVGKQTFYNTETPLSYPIGDGRKQHKLRSNQLFSGVFSKISGFEKQIFPYGENARKCFLTKKHNFFQKNENVVYTL